MYDELIAVLDDLDIALDNGFGKASTFIACTKATRKVIELHRPFTIKDEVLCEACCANVYLTEHPCPTIQAIAEELK